MLNKEKGTLCEGVGIHRTIMLKEHTPTLSCIVTLILYNELAKLIDLSLVTHNGLILGKYLPRNQNLKYFRLQNVNDLYILLDGLASNLVELNVSLHESHMTEGLALPKSWPQQSMFYLKRLKLRTDENAEFTFDELNNTVIPLINLNSLTIHIENWVSQNEQFMPQLEQFFCSICTTNHIDTTVKKEFDKISFFLIYFCVDFFKI